MRIEAEKASGRDLAAFQAARGPDLVLELQPVGEFDREIDAFADLAGPRRIVFCCRGASG